MQRLLNYLLPISLGISMAGWGATFPAAAVKQVSEAQNPKDLLASRFVTVTDKPEAWQLQYDGETVLWDKATMQLKLSGSHGDWQFLASKDAVVRQDGKDYSVALDSAGKREFSLEEFAGVSGVKVRLSDFQSDGVALDLQVVLFVGLEWQTGDILLEIRPVEGQAALRECHWPGSVDGSEADATILPFMQGIMIPRNWPDSFDAPYNDGPGYGLAYGRNLYMPWWGMTKGAHSLMTILENPDDAGIGIKHTPERGTVLEPWQLHSLGRMGYTRKIRLSPLSGNYVQMTRRYRQYLKERGNFIGIEEKIARTPGVARLFGSPIIHTLAEYTEMRQSKNPEGDSWQIPYAEHIDNLRRLKQQGVEDLYLHVDGVGFHGYDNMEPDPLPVGRRAGGIEGLRQMLATVRELDYQVVYHQQYRDFYLDAASYDQDLLKQSEDGSYQIDDYWAGGKNAIICPLRSADYTRRNNTVLDILEAPVDGCYLDVFAVVPGDECYNPEHRISRTQCYDLRRQCFGYIKSKWGITSSEEPVAWAVPYLDLSHHAPWPVTPQKKAFGIQLPLHTLVYHDSIVTPWDTETRRGKAYYSNADDIPYLFALLNAGMPYLSEKPTADELERVKFAARLHQRLGKLPMTNHEVLDASGLRQRATYADGTRISIDQEFGNAEIVYPEGQTVKLSIDPELGTVTGLPRE